MSIPGQHADKKGCVAQRLDSAPPMKAEGITATPSVAKQIRRNELCAWGVLRGAMALDESSASPEMKHLVSEKIQPGSGLNVSSQRGRMS